MDKNGPKAIIKIMKEAENGYSIMKTEQYKEKEYSPKILIKCLLCFLLIRKGFIVCGMMEI